VSSYLAIVEDDGIPLWMLEPTMENVQRNVRVGWMEPFVLCVVMVEHLNGTCLVAYDGIVAFAVTACLFEVL
jgi:hypothetical protein